MAIFLEEGTYVHRILYSQNIYLEFTYRSIERVITVIERKLIPSGWEYPSEIFPLVLRTMIVAESISTSCPALPKHHIRLNISQNF